MKIARIIGPEEVRNVQTHGHAGGSQMIPFAESFNESMPALASTPGGLQRELPDGDVALHGNEEMKWAGKDRPSMAHLLSEALEGISSGPKKILPNEGANESRSEGASSGEETTTLSDPLKALATKTSEKIQTSEVHPEGYKISQSSGTQQEDTSAAGTGPANAKDVPPVKADLKEALMADAVQVMPQEKVHAPKEGHRLKEGIKTQQESKASKKEEADGGTAVASVAQEMPVTTETNASVAAAPLVSIMPLPTPPKDLSAASDDSFSPAVAMPKSAREMTGKAQVAQMKNASQVSLVPAKANGGPKQLVDPSLTEAATLPIKGETRSSAGLKKDEDASIVSPLSEKNHSLSQENAFNLVSSEAPIHGQGVLASLPEKVAPVHTFPADAQPEAAPITPQLYGTDAHKTLMVSPTALEVGVPGGTHGWLKVRAELTGDGVVHASVSSSSPAGTEMLRRELPSLTSYLHQEQLPVGSVVVQASSSGMDDRSFAGGGQGQDPGQGTTDPGGGARQENGTVYRGEDAIHPGISNEMEGQDSPLSSGYAGGGRWLSIRA